MKKYIRGVIMSAVILSALQLPLQPFGKNKVITRDFRWEICHTEHFDVYFYEEGRNVLPFFVDLLERVYRRATALSGVEITEKIPVFLYIGHNEFEQTNITDIGEGTGGVTEAFKNRLVVPHLGSRAWLEYVMHHEFAHEVQYAVLFSGFWKSAKLLKFPIYPLWLMEGLAEYHTGALGLTEKEMYLRDATLSGNLIPLDKMQNFSHLKPHYVTLAYKESHALMDFIVEEYGEQKPYEILNSYKDKFDAASVLLETINITLQNLDVKFREHMEDKYRFASAGMKEPQEYGLRVTKPNIYWTFNTNPVFLPGDMGGKDSRIAFITDKRGVEEIVMQDARSGKTTTLVGKRDIDYVENISRLGRGISVSGDGRYLVFVGEKEQKDRIYIYDMKSRGIERIELDFSVINSADISHDGRRVVFIGMRGGHTDIYSSDLDGKNLRRHTSDFNSVSDAVLSKNGKFIVFAKERTVNDIERPHQRDLYKLDIETGSTTRLTDFSKDEFSPAISPDDATVIFVSDKDGVYDLYALDLATMETRKLTNVIGGNFTPSFSTDGRSIVFSSYRKGEKHVFMADIDKLENRAIFYSKHSRAGQSEMPADGITGRGLSYSPYRFHPSTDLFFPVLYYSTLDGLYLALYWQLSEMTGNHSATFYTQYVSAAEFMNYQFVYRYSRFRPQVFLALQGDGGYIDWYARYHSQSHSQYAGVSYPFSRFNRVDFILKHSMISMRDRLAPDIRAVAKDHAAQMSIVRDTSAGKYIEVTRGYRLKITQTAGTRSFGADFEYQNTSVEAHRFFPLGREHVLATRVLGMTSAGRDRYNFGLYGYNRLRHTPLDKNNRYIEPWYGSNLFLHSLEWRFPIVYDINYYMWYIFPDFFFKSFYGSILADTGVVWTDRDPLSSDIRYCYGVGLKFDTFILQAFYLPLNFYLTYSPLTDRYEFLFTLGMAF